VALVYGFGSGWQPYTCVLGFPEGHLKKTTHWFFAIRFELRSSLAKNRNGGGSRESSSVYGFQE
jgi:hypothetical protein